MPTASVITLILRLTSIWNFKISRNIITMIRLPKMEMKKTRKNVVTVLYLTCGINSRPNEEMGIWSSVRIQWSNRQTLLHQSYLQCLIQSCPLVFEDNFRLFRIWVLAIGLVHLFHLEVLLKPDSSFREVKATNFMCTMLKRCRPSPWRRHQVMDFSVAECIMILPGLGATMVTSLSST